MKNRYKLRSFFAFSLFTVFLFSSCATSEILYEDVAPLETGLYQIQKEENTYMRIGFFDDMFLYSSIEDVSTRRKVKEYDVIIFSFFFVEEKAVINYINNGTPFTFKEEEHRYCGEYDSGDKNAKVYLTPKGDGGIEVETPLFKEEAIKIGHYAEPVPIFAVDVPSF